MLAKGNGAVNVCVNNLLRVVRGEVPYDRIKGLDPSLIDQNASLVAPEVQQNAEWTIGIYEPRADVQRISVGRSDSANGLFNVTAEIKIKEG